MSPCQLLACRIIGTSNNATPFPRRVLPRSGSDREQVARQDCGFVFNVVLRWLSAVAVIREILVRT